MNDWFVATSLVKFVHRAYRRAREGHSRSLVPGFIGRPTVQRGSSRIDQREEEHLTCVSGCFLKRIQHSWCPREQLQLVEGIVTPTRLRFGITFVARRQIVEMHLYAILSC